VAQGVLEALALGHYDEFLCVAKAVAGILFQKHVLLWPGKAAAG